MKRVWAIYDVFLGYPVLVERCDTQGAPCRSSNSEAFEAAEPFTSSSNCCLTALACWSTTKAAPVNRQDHRRLDLPEMMTLPGGWLLGRHVRSFWPRALRPQLMIIRRDVCAVR